MIHEKNSGRPPLPAVRIRHDGTGAQTPASSVHRPKKIPLRIPLRRAHAGPGTENNGYVDPETGEQWYADVDNYSPGFSVGVLGEMRLNTYLSLRLVPTLHFGQKHVSFHEQRTGQDSTQNIKSTYISVPLDLKFAAPRYNNFRPYFIAGVNPMVDLTTKKQKALLMKPFDCYIEVGMGCDIYLPFFKLIPELKFCFGLADILQKTATI